MLSNFANEINGLRCKRTININSALRKPSSEETASNAHVVAVMHLMSNSTSTTRIPLPMVVTQPHAISSHSAGNVTEEGGIPNRKKPGKMS